MKIIADKLYQGRLQEQMVHPKNKREGLQKLRGSNLCINFFVTFSMYTPVKLETCKKIIFAVGLFNNPINVDSVASSAIKKSVGYVKRHGFACKFSRSLESLHQGLKVG